MEAGGLDGAMETPTVFVVDVDGVMTTGQFLYSADGKTHKLFGPDDHDALLLLRPHIEIMFLTGDRKGFPITKRRIVDDMEFPLELVSTVRRLEWLADRFDPRRVIYMGDGIFDVYVAGRVGYTICPSNAFYLLRERADFVTRSPGGDRAVAEACLHILERFFTPFDSACPPTAMAETGEWTP